MKYELNLCPKNCQNKQIVLLNLKLKALYSSCYLTLKAKYLVKKFLIVAIFDITVIWRCSHFYSLQKILQSLFREYLKSNNYRI